MDIGRLSMAMSQNSIQNAVSMQVMKMTMDTGEETAANMKNMIDSMDPNLGNHIDSRA